MPRYCVTGPDGMDYEWLVADSPTEAMHKLHADAFGTKAVRLVDGELVFQDPADQELCAGLWRVTECRSDGTAADETEILIGWPERVAA
jgi:hypothetical protein